MNKQNLELRFKNRKQLLKIYYEDDEIFGLTATDIAQIAKIKKDNNKKVVIQNVHHFNKRTKGYILRNCESFFPDWNVVRKMIIQMNKNTSERKILLK